LAGVDVVGRGAIGEELSSRLDVRSPEYAANVARMRELVDEVRRLELQLLAGGGERYVERHRARGKLMVRERIDAVVDPGSPFLELQPLGGWGTDDPLGGGFVYGIGIVSGVECVIAANDPTVRGGSASPTTIGKVLRCNEVAARNRLPLVNLTESGGADLPRQAEIFVPGGAQFKNLTRLAAAGIPVVTVVLGSSTAGGAYVPGMSDYTVFVRGRSRVFLGGPPLVKMATDEDADEEELGGAEMHARVSGLADYLAADEEHAFALARGIVRHLRWTKLGPGRTEPDDPPAHDPAELLGVAPADPRESFDCREVLARVLDGSRFEEFKPLYGSTLVCGWGSVHGFAVGVLGNNGILFSEEARKGTQFISLCNRMDVPLLFLQNITGFMVGTRYEREGIVKDGSKLINAVANSAVPHITLMIGASYGAGNYAMSGRAFDPRFVFTWPNHRIAVMGGRQLAGVLSIVRRSAAAAAGRPFDEAEEAQIRDRLESQIEEESTALFATGRLWDDGVIDPRETRTVLGIALSAVHSAPVRGTAEYAAFRM
jgi:acetyl-CoA carboxylase carboxyltransferase component